MRSRDGDKNISRSVSAVIFLLCSLALNASEHLISYRYLVKNAILYNESLDISKSMLACKGEARESIVFESPDDDNLKRIISTNNEEFIAFIHKIGLSVEHKEKTTNFTNSSTTILTLKTTCFKVDFNDTFVRISALK